MIGIPDVHDMMASKGLTVREKDLPGETRIRER
jgi:hypothetical protein